MRNCSIRTMWINHGKLGECQFPCEKKTCFTLFGRSSIIFQLGVRIFNRFKLKGKLDLETDFVYVCSLEIFKWNRKRLSFDFANLFSFSQSMCSVWDSPRFALFGKYKHRKSGECKTDHGADQHADWMFNVQCSLVIWMKTTTSTLHSIAHMPISRWFAHSIHLILALLFLLSIIEIKDNGSFLWQRFELWLSSCCPKQNQPLFLLTTY